MQGSCAIRFLPLAVWPQRALFVGAKDRNIKYLTKGAFPTVRKPLAKTHPLFVLETVSNLAHRVCPCSTKRYLNHHFIPEGCELEHTSYRIAKRTYLVEDCIFQVPKDKNFLWSLRYWGKVPDGCIKKDEG